MKLGAQVLTCLALVAFATLDARTSAAVTLAPRTYYVGAIGRSHDVASTDPRVWLEYELEDWKDPKTGSTLVSEQRCGLGLKFRLLGSHRRNYLEIEAQADLSEGLRHFDPDKIEMDFGSGLVRTRGYMRSPVALDLGPSDELFAAIPFPEKSDFEGKSEIRIRVPLSECVAEAVFKRPEGVPELAESSMIWSSMQLGLELGSGIAKTGSLKNVASNGVQGGLSVTRYPWMNHGFWLGIEFQNLGGPSGLGLGFGYSFRHYFSQRLTFHYDIAPGIYELSDASSSLQPQSLSNALYVVQRLGMDFVFARLHEPAFLESDHAVGLLFTDDWLPGASLAGSSASGQNFSLQFRYLFGM